ncbi:alpha/beta hydrolase [Mycobacterium sp. 852002-51163_SCH5372311]|uniref:alpha/beta hydrolase n=1 Tax=Mycobacterium sp. 852002-51163_SCH5372311 TaxID=1834097 RepID=UPI000B19BA1F|nr:alpha/beta hydrolase [Mycobacterium sp. 852002-51163_SCH5372311]
MTLTLADIERWDPGAVAAVFEAAIKRAHGTRVASAALSDTTRLLDFGGDAADAAQLAIHHTTVILDTHADACQAVARAAQKSVEEITVIKSRLRAIRQTARDLGLTIDDVTGTVVPPGGFPWLSTADRDRISEAHFDLTRGITNLLADAERADEDLAAAIRGAEGDLSAEQVDAQISGTAVEVLQTPPSGSSPAGVNKWWHSLTPGQQDRVKERYGGSIRNLDGIPADVRSELNMPVLQREIDRLENGWLNADGWHTNPDKLADLIALQQALTAHPGARLMLLDADGDPRKVLAAIAIGDVDDADCVGVTVGGLNTRVSSSVGQMVREAEAQRNKASELRRLAGKPGYDAVASVVWLGYDAPDSLTDVSNIGLARKSAGSLNNFYKALAATTSVADQRITALGHSYGSLVTSLALQQGAPVSDVVLYGSPGIELGDAAQLGVQPGHAYYLIGVNDHVADVIPGFGIFGRAPQDVPGMTELSTSTGLALGGQYGDGQVHERAYGHSEYPRVGSNGELRMSAYNMAAVLAGLPDDLVMPRASGVDRLPGGSGPYELPPAPPQHQL